MNQNSAFIAVKGGKEVKSIGKVMSEYFDLIDSGSLLRASDHPIKNYWKFYKHMKGSNKISRRIVSICCNLPILVYMTSLDQNV